MLAPSSGVPPMRTTSQLWWSVSDRCQHRASLMRGERWVKFLINVPSQASHCNCAAFLTHFNEFIPHYKAITLRSKCCGLGLHKAGWHSLRIWYVIAHSSACSTGADWSWLQWWLQTGSTRNIYASTIGKSEHWSLGDCHHSICNVWLVAKFGIMNSKWQTRQFWLQSPLHAWTGRCYMSLKYTIYCHFATHFFTFCKITEILPVKIPYLLDKQTLSISLHRMY